MVTVEVAALLFPIILGWRGGRALGFEQWGMGIFISLLAFGLSFLIFEINLLGIPPIIMPILTVVIIVISAVVSKNQQV